MKLLTVRQPWASLLVFGFKRIENRSRSTDYRGDVAIIAGQKVDTGERAMRAALCLPRAQRDPFMLPRGAIIGLVELWDVVDTSPSWWFTGPFGWRVRNAREIEPVISRPGHQGFRNADAALIARINARVK